MRACSPGLRAGIFAVEIHSGVVAVHHYAPTDMVWREKEYVRCGRTIGLLSDTVARRCRRADQKPDREQTMVGTMIATCPAECRDRTSASASWSRNADQHGTRLIERMLSSGGCSVFDLFFDLLSCSVFAS